MAATQQQELVIVNQMETKPELVRAESPTPMLMIQMLVQQGADIDKIGKFMDLQERWEANEARRAFVDAMAAFKAEQIQIIKDKDNNQYKSKYVSIGNLVGTVTPFLSKHGLSAGWEIDQTNGIKVTCVITHKLGHSKSVSMIVPPDKSGAKNPIQEIKSAITYAKACTFESVCGLASSDANLDDDGNGGKQSGMAEEAVRDYLDTIRQATSREELQTQFQKAYGAATSAKDKPAQEAFIAAKSKRFKEVR